MVRMTISRDAQAGGVPLAADQGIQPPVQFGGVQLDLVGQVAGELAGLVGGFPAGQLVVQRIDQSSRR